MLMINMVKKNHNKRVSDAIKKSIVLAWGDGYSYCIAFENIV